LGAFLPAEALRGQAQAEKGKSLDLHDVAEMVATLEDLVRREADLQLAEVYEALGHSSTSFPLSRTEAEEVVDMYMVLFLTARNITFADPEKNKKRLNNFKKKYRGFKEVHHWLEGVENVMMPSDADEFNYETMSKVVETVGDLYPEFNDQECVDLKTTMMKMEGGSRKAGRIPLADFYNASLYSHWKFTESPDYLRDLGALDEADPLRPQVILANYIASFNNCLRATSLYAVCCRSPCERLMASLEEQVASPSEAPERLAALVADLSTDTVPARVGGLEGKLTERLQSIAASTADSKVPIHGRLFAQWMHHAFPRECPYPHERGTTNPQTPDEWMASNGRSIAVSEEQLKQIAEDFCPSSGLDVITADGNIQAPNCAGQEDEDLPWSNQEELLDHHANHARLPAQAEEEPAPHYGFFLVLCLPAALLGGYAMDVKLGQRGEALQRKGRAVMVCLAVAAIGVATGLLDVRLAFGAGLLFFLWRRATAPRMVLPLAEKKLELI